MPDPFDVSMEKSKQHIERNKDLIFWFLKASDIMSCEDTGESVATHLDTMCGIDCIVINRDDNISRGVGCRFQVDNVERYGRKFYTFTFRKERESGAMTEFEKRKRAIETGGLYPFWTLHGYIDPKDSRIDRMAIAKTSDIVQYILNEDTKTSHTRSDQHGQAGFYYIEWKDFKSKGYSVRLWFRHRKEGIKLFEINGQFTLFKELEE